MRKVFIVDGFVHQVGSAQCCGAKPCWCGGRIHRQETFNECDNCGGSLPRLHSTPKTLEQLNAVKK